MAGAETDGIFHPSVSAATMCSFWDIAACRLVARVRRPSEVALPILASGVCGGRPGFRLGPPFALAKVTNNKIPSDSMVALGMTRAAAVSFACRRGPRSLASSFSDEAIVMKSKPVIRHLDSGLGKGTCARSWRGFLYFCGGCPTMRRASVSISASVATVSEEGRAASRR
jgi:hypothetical protein